MPPKLFFYLPTPKRLIRDRLCLRTNEVACGKRSAVRNGVFAARKTVLPCGQIAPVQRGGWMRGNGRIFGEIMHQKVRVCIKLQKLRKKGFCGAFAVGDFGSKPGVKTVKIGSWARLFTTRIKVHLTSTKNRIRASKSHKSAVFVPFSAIFPPIYAPKNTLFPPQQIIVIHCEYPQTPCAPMGLSLS